MAGTRFRFESPLFGGPPTNEQPKTGIRQTAENRPLPDNAMRCDGGFNRRGDLVFESPTERRVRQF
eukprot:7972320-Heterocapsa_arctica.AAC.1